MSYSLESALKNSALTMSMIMDTALRQIAWDGDGM